MVYFLVYVNYAYLMRNHHWTHALSHLSSTGSYRLAPAAIDWHRQLD